MNLLAQCQLSSSSRGSLIWLVCVRAEWILACVHPTTGSKALVRRSDGVLVSVATSPYPIMVYDMLKRGQWDKATRLCRFIKVGGAWFVPWEVRGYGHARA